MDYILQEIKQRRLRQISLGYDTEHDKEHTNGAIAAAAGCYAIKGGLITRGIDSGISDEEKSEEILDASDEDLSLLNSFFWPWPESSILREPMSARECLLRSAALIVAEIQRRDLAGLDSLKEPHTGREA